MGNNAKRYRKTVFESLSIGGVIHTCIDVIRQRYDLGLLPESTPLPDNWEYYYQNTLPQKIREAVDTFDDSVIRYVESPLIDEISDNLSECQTMKEKERYLSSYPCKST
ncbi:hypothetical protein EZS27_018512 [termite gut metagenome]|uniref:Uncharacterized protein n=1 Tax=termite gut metagenome TaxID=433724 RepID=A0A5J4RIX3_9ZZZZ